MGEWMDGRIDRLMDERVDGWLQVLQGLAGHYQASKAEGRKNKLKLPVTYPGLFN